MRARWSPAEPDRGRPAPVFLVGFPRSGTTLLDTLLMGHPARPRARGGADPAAGRRSARRFRPAAGARRGRGEAAARALFRRARRLRPERAGKTVVDKLPLNILGAPLIHRLFPEAKLIFAERHPCDVVLSCFMQNFDLNDAMANFLDLGDAARLYDLVARLLDAGRGRSCRSTSTRSATRPWSRTRRREMRAADRLPRPALGRGACSTIRATAAEARADRHAELRPGRPADLPPRGRPLGALSRATGAGAADPRPLGRKDGLCNDDPTPTPPIAPGWPRWKRARRRRRCEALEAARAVHPRDARLWHVGGLLHRALGDLAPAIPCCDTAASLAPLDFGIAHLRARVAFEAGLPAVALYERTLRIEPRDSARIGLIEAIQQEQGPARGGRAARRHAGGRSGLDRGPCLSGAARLHRRRGGADHRLVRARAGGDGRATSCCGAS